MEVCTGTGGTGIDVPNLMKCPVPVYTEFTEVSSTGIDVVPNLPKCPVAVLMMYRTYQSVRYRYESLYRYGLYRYPCRTVLTEVSGTGVHAVPNLPKCPVPVLMSYRT